MHVKLSTTSGELLYLNLVKIISHLWFVSKFMLEEIEMYVCFSRVLHRFIPPKQVQGLNCHSFPMVGMIWWNEFIPNIRS